MNKENNDYPNYAYFCGALQSTLESLSWDYRFHAMETTEERKAYIQKMIADCRKSAVAHENEINAMMSKR